MSTSKRRSPHSKVGDRKDSILSPGDVKKGEVILALLFRPHDKYEAHIIKIMNLKGGRKGLARLLKGDMWRDIRETFLARIAAE